MARLKVDGIIEAVRYTSNGSISVVRAYERRGAVWSDQVLLQRKELVEKLSKGRRFLTGRRKLYLGSLFETGTAIGIIGGHVVSEGTNAVRDQLAGVHVF